MRHDPLRHDPFYYAKFHGYGILLSWYSYVLSMIIIILTQEGHKANELATTMLFAFFGSWIALEVISAFYRYLFMEGIFRNYVVIMKIAITKTDLARCIAREMAVMPATKAHKIYTSWWSDIRNFWMIISICAMATYAITISAS